MDTISHSDIEPFILNTYTRAPIVLSRGKGCRVWDAHGKEYLDFVAGIATCALGHAHPEICKTIQHQSLQLMHVSNLYYTAPQGALARWLVEHSCAKGVFFCNSGAEANEAAIKLTRKYFRQRHGSRESIQPIILTARHSFHGRTLATLSATGQPKYQRGFEPLVPGFEYVAFNDVESLQIQAEIVSSTPGCALAGIMLEPIQGEGGVIPGTRDFFSAARRLCESHDALLIFDEVQSGIGRTGTIWAYEHLGITPDIITSAKALGGGFPIGAMLANERAAVFEPGEHASTFGGNPLACAVAYTVCNAISSPDFLRQVELRGQKLHSALEELVERYPELLLEARGWGLMQGLVLRDTCDLSAATITGRALSKGLLLVGAGPKVVRFLPPLIVTDDELAEGLGILEEVIKG